MYVWSRSILTIKTRLIFVYMYTGWLLSYVLSFIRYKISCTQTILVIMVLIRDCNSNIFNDFKRFFDSMT